MSYLQASLYRGFVEINHLLALSPDGDAAIRLHFESYIKGREIAGKNEPTTIQEQPQAHADQTEQARIELLCDESEIKKNLVGSDKANKDREWHRSRRFQQC